MKNYILFFCFSISFIFSCGNEQLATETTLKETKENIDIPELLDRHAKLRQGTEWDQIQRLYVAQQQALRKDVTDAEAYLKLAYVFVNEARITGEHGHYYPGALQVLDQSLQITDISDDLRFRLLSTKASVQLSQHDFSVALETAQSAVKLNPYNAQIYGAIVDANVELGNYEAAVAAADKMVQIRPDLRSYSRVAYLREIHGDIPGTEEALDMAIKAGFPGQESTSWVRLTLAEFYERYGQQDKAQLQYQMILAERPDYPFAIAGLAKLDAAAGKLVEAEEKLIEATAIIPEVGFYIELAKIYKATDRLDLLEKTKEEILIMLQEDVDSGHRMDMEYADLYLELYEDFDTALIHAKIEYDRRPENIDVNRMLAKIYQQKGEAELAKKFAQVAAKTNSKHPELSAII